MDEMPDVPVTPPQHYLSLFAWSVPSAPGVGIHGHVYSYGLDGEYRSHHSRFEHSGLLVWSPELLASMYEEACTAWLRLLGPFGLE